MMIWPSMIRRARARSSSRSRVIIGTHGAVGQRRQRLLGDEPAERLAHRHAAGLQCVGEIEDTQLLRRQATPWISRPRSSAWAAIMQRLAADQESRSAAIHAANSGSRRTDVCVRLDPNHSLPTGEGHRIWV